MHKPGWKTTEFWLTVAADTAAIVGDVAHVLPDRYAVILGGISTGLYTLSRGWVKAGK